MDDRGGLLDWSALQVWLTSSPAPGNGPVVAFRELAGGTQNHLFHLTREDGTEMVLRRPPRHPRPNSNETMLREARVLASLSGSDVPHPAFLAVCDERFYVVLINTLNKIMNIDDNGLKIEYVCCHHYSPLISALTPL